MLKTLLTAALFTTALTSMSYADTKGPIKSVTLSSGGLAEIHRSASIENDGKILIEVPLDQVDDILKSLIVLDKDGSVKGISLAGPQPVEETFRTLPFSERDLQSLPSLLSNLQGAKVSVTSGGKTLEGKVLGVIENQTKDAGQKYTLSLLSTSGKLTSMPLDDTTEVVIEDENIQNKINAAVEAAGKGKSDGSRTVAIEMGGKGERDVGISYVVSAPIWKTAYRVVIDDNKKARIQSWAVLENASGEDWKDVSITLASGSPVTLKQRLHDRIWKDRTEVALNTLADKAPSIDTGNLQNKRMQQARNFGAIASDMNYPAMAAAPQVENYENIAQTDTNKAIESDISTSFPLKGTHNLTNGDTLSIPIVDEEVDAETVSIYKLNQNSNHPVASFEFKNTTGAGLPGGIITVYDKENGYVGDAQLPSMAPNETRFASFATDKKITVIPSFKNNRKINKLKVVDGVITTSGSIKNETDYTISAAPDSERNVILEHPKNDWNFSTKEEYTETPTHYRIKVKAPAGETIVVKVIDEMPTNESYAIGYIDDTMIAQWQNDVTDEETKAKLSELQRVKQEQALAQYQVEDAQRIIQNLNNEQNRIRNNLAAVPNASDMHKKYLKELDRTETKLQDYNKKLEENIIILNKWKNTANDIVRTF